MAKIVDHGGWVAKLVGDAHLGRKFIHGVPMHRRGERERMMLTQFANEIDGSEVDLVVQMGDIFDKAVVPYNVLDDTAEIIERAAKEDNNTVFAILAGNHDLSKDVDKVSAFLLLKRMLRHVPNVVLVTEPTVIRSYVLFPYNVYGSAEELVNEATYGDACVALGHYDTTNYGGDNTIPLSALARRGIKYVYTGHIHSPGVIVSTEAMYAEKVGSMQPYARGEESDEGLYVTRTLDTLGSEDYSNKCLRVVLKKGEDVPDVDCLQLTIKRLGDNGEDEGDIDVDFETFDSKKLFDESMEAAGVSAPIISKVKDKFISLKGEQ